MKNEGRRDGPHIVLFLVLTGLLFGQVVAWALGWPSLFGSRAEGQVPRPLIAAGDLDRRIAVEQSQWIWERRNPRTYDPARAEEIVDEHFRAGMRGMLWYSRVYFDSGASWNPRMRSRGSINGEHAKGIADILWSTFRSDPGAREACADLGWGSHLVYDVRAATRLHLRECAPYWYGSGGNGWHSIRSTFLPRSPYGGRCNQEARRWDQIGDRHDALISDFWREREPLD